ncbi:hypothetical protein B0T16DRAFT_415551 [Cercophora newfieldiana]|uniref:Uncharacterized protein n=1 Tax=Cercophora newfieldiana TaxID=92897 RepID=A0AA40CLW8_9PEZI|nr:hypothetical protein B0T16DRAFT_415551 [Cercophora newfieldiana]
MAWFWSPTELFVTNGGGCWSIHGQTSICLSVLLLADGCWLRQGLLRGMKMRVGSRCGRFEPLGVGC